MEQVTITADILPNCLLRDKTRRSVMSQNGMEWLRLFCANCGADGGLVLKTDLPAEFAFYQCNPCAEKYGHLTGTWVEPDAAFRARVQGAMVEEYGHILTETEILIALDDQESVISKLEREAKGR